MLSFFRRARYNCDLFVEVRLVTCIFGGGYTLPSEGQAAPLLLNMSTINYSPLWSSLLTHPFWS